MDDARSPHKGKAHMMASDLLHPSVSAAVARGGRCGRKRQVIMLQRVLVPLDGSPQAEAVLSPVEAFLSKETSVLVLLQAVHAGTILGRAERGPALEERRGEAQRYLHGLVRRFEERGFRVRARIGEGLPVESILRVSGEEAITMVAMTTHGRSGVGRWIMGSVAEEVLSRSLVPIFLVRSSGPLPSSFAVRKVLVPVDGSEEALSIVPYVDEIARVFWAEVVTLHVRQRQSVVVGVPVAGWPSPPPFIPEVEHEGAAEHAAGEFRRRGIRVRSLAVKGDPASRILEVARTGGADLIAMATRARSGMRRFLLGSVAEDVLRHTKVPVLLARHEGMS